MLYNTEFYEVFLPPYVLIGISVLFSFMVTFIAIPSIVRVAKIRGLMANPNGRTSHTNPTPNLGGVAIFAGVIISSILFTGIATAHELKYIIAAMIIIFFVGLKDDFYPMIAYKKFIGQTVAILFILVPGDFHLTSLHGLFGINELSYGLSLVITFIIALALINSFNLIDGIDGLASGIGILTSVFFGIVFLRDNHLAYAIMTFILSSSLLTFFYFNVFSEKNKIFLGDTGAMLIGLLLAIFVVRFLNYENSSLFFNESQSAPAILLSVLIIPVFDTARVFILRILRGKSPFEADRTHIHHRLLDLSGSHIKATAIILSVNVIFIAIALIFRNINTELLIVIILVLAAASSYIPVYLKRRNQIRSEKTFSNSL
ncbi:MAG: undecaprenyl/decaprenyl-phosphate alpha-N-acetylglucosaminyl 1-phosphate transferase [Bacteroidales bacterium]|nr:undecaprenyl/decaprenyl-phosphate alpha-N-acetylglucosaminyl 1-phosphate transferase [Bacteroidales bacterium]